MRLERTISPDTGEAKFQLQDRSIDQFSKIAIGLFDWFIFNIKDVYLTIGAAIAILWLIIFTRGYYMLTKDERK